MEYKKENYELRYCYFNISNENMTQLLETIVKIAYGSTHHE